MRGRVKEKGRVGMRKRHSNDTRQGRLCALFLGGILLTVGVRPCQASLFGAYWSRFDRFLATFDPAGRYVRQPIEKQIPALTFKGFYRQWSDILLTGNEQVSNRDKDFRFLQIQNLFELEMHYQVSPNIEITNVDHFLYDGVYNWQDSAGLFAPRRTETLRAYHNFERIVRELYLS